MIQHARVALPAVAVAALMTAGRALPASSDAGVVAQDTPHQRGPCTSAQAGGRAEIRFGEEGAVSVCRADGAGDCLYSHAFGKTYLHARADLNMDGRDDLLIKDFSGIYGMHEIVHFMGFVDCPGSFQVKVMDGFFTDVNPKGPPRSGQWREIRATRACFDERHVDTVTRQYTIRFDRARSSYGTPDGNPALAEFCSPTELAMPIQPQAE